MNNESWRWGMLDAGRVDRARKVKLISVDLASRSCRCAGSSGAVYDTTLSSCSCADFAVQHGAQPCKHILRLAIELGIINKNGLTSDQQAEADRKSAMDRLARAYGYYYLFRTPVMADEEYDALKSKWT